MVIDKREQHGWYAVFLSIEGQQTYFRRYAGRVETGEHRKTDPYMGRRIEQRASAAVDNRYLLTMPMS